MRRLKIIPVIRLPDLLEEPSEIDPVAQNFLTGLKDFLTNRQARVAVYFPGGFLERTARHFPKEFAWIRELAKDGILEPLGGGYHEALFPLFPAALQIHQIRRHKDRLQSTLSFFPRGWFCPDKAWEISLVETLVGQDFEYTILADSSFSEALSQPLPITAWRTVENNGFAMRVFPSQGAVSDAWAKGDSPYMLRLIADLPELDSGILFETNFHQDAFRSLSEILENGSQLNLDLQCWTPSRIIDQSRSAGSVSLISTLGDGMGMPIAVHTCRELLNRRPESSFIHKKILFLHSRAHQILQDSEALAIDALLLPLMSAKFYRNLPSPTGIRGLANRSSAHRQLIEAEKALDKLSGRSQRLEILDLLANGGRQILVSTPDLGFVLDHQEGGILHSLDFKPLSLNWINGQFENGSPSVALRDHLIPTDHRTLNEILGSVEDRDGELMNPMDYQIKRQADRNQLVLTGEQGVPVGGRAHSFRTVKVIGYKLDEAEIQVSWQLTNATFQLAQCQFATECVVTFPDQNRRKQYVTLGGKRLSWSDVPCVRSDVQTLAFADRSIGARMIVDFRKAAHVVISPVLGTAQGAAPDEFQGIRLLFLWDLELKGQESTSFHVRVRMDKRRFLP